MNSVPLQIRAQAELELRRRRGIGSHTSSYQRWTARLRPSQVIPDGNWFIYILQSGRGGGKTLAGSIETIKRSETCPRIAIVAADFADGRDICVEGETGIKTILPDVSFNRSMGELHFPSGALGKIYSAEDPESLRGPNNYFAWCDEFCKWRYQKETWEQLVFTLRLGKAQALLTTTPKVSKLFTEIKSRSTTIVIRESARANKDNLAASFQAGVWGRYEDTRLGQQEIEGIELEDTPGALWSAKLLEEDRVSSFPDLVRVVVGIDPAVTASEDSDHTGLIAAGLGKDKQGYILDDKSLRASPLAWAREAVALLNKYKGDRIVAETNNGGDMVETTLRTVDRNVPYKKVVASRGKLTRAEPVAALYEQHKVHHVGTFSDLEAELTTWVPGASDSPDRLDALVWCITELMLGGGIPDWKAQIF